MANVISNGEFLVSLAPWVADAQCSWLASDGDKTLGCAVLGQTAGQNASIYNAFVAPGCDPVEQVMVRLRFSVKAAGGTVPVGLTVDVYSTSTTYYTLTLTGASYNNVWVRISQRFAVPQGETLKVRFSALKDASANHWRIDDVFLAEDLGNVGSCADLTLELRKLRGDLGAVKHPQVRYEELVNKAIARAPMTLWNIVQVESVLTVEDQRQYDLSGLAGLTKPEQVRRVWLEDSDDEFRPIGRWDVLDTGSYCALELDAAPAEDDLKIRIEYLAPWDTLDCSDETDTTALVRDWILAKAMTLLLMEAQGEDPNWVLAQMQLWDQERKSVEAQHRLRRPSSPARTYDWGQWRSR